MHHLNMTESLGPHAPNHGIKRPDETQVEYIFSFILGAVFLIIAVISAKRYVQLVS